MRSRLLLAVAMLLLPGGTLAATAPRLVSMNVCTDQLLLTLADDYVQDDGQAFPLHPALERFYPPEERIVIPERMMECGGVLLADALTAELKRVGK
jgi:iron complex transport system substrate-binding protein